MYVTRTLLSTVQNTYKRSIPCCQCKHERLLSGWEEVELCNEKNREREKERYIVQEWIFDDNMFLRFFFFLDEQRARRAPLKIVFVARSAPKVSSGPRKHLVCTSSWYQNGFYGRPQTVLNKNLLKDRTVWLIAPSGGASLPLARPFLHGRGHGYQTAVSGS